MWQKQGGGGGIKVKVRRDVCYKEILCSTEEAVVVFKNV